MDQNRKKQAFTGVIDEEIWKETQRVCVRGLKNALENQNRY